MATLMQNKQHFQRESSLYQKLEFPHHHRRTCFWHPQRNPGVKKSKYHRDSSGQQMYAPGYNSL